MNSSTDSFDSQKFDGKLLFQETLHVIPDAFLLFDKEEKVFLANPQAEVLFEFDFEELLGKTIENLVPDRFYMHAKQLRLQMQEPDSFQEAKKYDFYILQKSGSELPVEISLKSIKTELGILTLSVFKDVSENRNVTLTLNETESKLREVQDIARIGYWNYNIVEDTLEWSKELFRIFGFKPDKQGITLGTFLDAVHPEDKEYVENIYNSFVKNNVHFKINYRIARPDGEIRTVQEKCKNFYNQAGKPVGSIGIVQDVTEQKYSEDALRISERRFRDISFSMADYIWEVDQDGCYTYISDSAKRLLGYDPKDLIGKSLFDFVPERYAEIYEQFFKQKLSDSAEIEDLEITFKHKNGKVISLLSNGVPIIDRGGKLTGYRGVDKDITEKKRTEEVLKSSLNLTQLMPSLSVEEVVSVVLDESVRLTRSEIGFFHFINDDGNKLESQVWSKCVKDECVTMKEVGHESLNKAGIWADCVREKEPIIYNDYQNVFHKTEMPDKHIDLTRILTVPIMEGENAVGVIGVGNKLDDYTRFDVDQLSLLAENTWGIIQRKKSEDALKESEKKYKTLFESAGDAILVHSLEGKYVDMNDNACTWLGYSRDELLKMGPGDIDTPEFRKLHPSRMEKIKKHKFVNCESAFITKEGSIIPVEMRSGLFEYNDEEYIISVTRDITERKKAARNLEESEIRLKEAQEMAHIGHWTLDIPTNELIWSDEVYRIFGLTPQEFEANLEAFSKRIHPEEKELVLNTYLKSVKDKKPYKIEHRIVRPDGEIRFVREDCKTIYNTKGEPLRSIGVVHDITEQKKSADALKRSEENYRNLFAFSTVPIVISSMKGNILDANPQACKQYGYVYDEFVKLTAMDLIHPDYHHVFVELTKSSDDFFGETVDVSKDGTKRFIEVRGTKIEYEGQPCLMVFLSDITDRKQIESELEQHRKQLENLVGERTIELEKKNELLEQEVKERIKAEEIVKGKEKQLRRQHQVLTKITEGKTFLGFELKDVFKRVTKVASEGMDVKRASIWLYNKNRTYIECEDLYESDKGEHSKGARLHKKDFPAYFSALKDYQIIAAYDAHNDKRTLEFSENYLTPLNIVSMLDAPIMGEGKLIGVVCLEHIGEKRKWSIEDESFVRSIADYTASFIETHKRVNAESELRKLSQAVEQSPSSVVITDTEGTIEYVNPKFEELTGYASKEAIGKNPRILKAGNQDYEVYEELWKTIVAGKKWRGELCNKKKNGEIYWEMASISPVRNFKGDITHYVAVKEDVTEQKRAEEELQKAMKIADEANRAKSDFLANMSHEIRTPMNAVLGFTELLYNETSDSEHKEYLESIKASGKSLLTLINDILDLSKIEAGKFEIQFDFIDAASFIKEIENVFSLNIEEKSLKLIIDIDPKIPVTWYVDEIRLRQVLINLISNAVKFTDKGYVKIKVWAENVQKEIVAGKEEEYVDLVIEVEDTGIGITKEYQRKIFESFSQQNEQSTKKFGGTGLGLAISRKLTELMNGSLTLSSKLNKGSNFKIFLKDVQVTRTKVDERTSLKFSIDKVKFREANIIVVDDVETNRNYIAGALKKTTLKVYEAFDGEQALKLLQTVKPDLIITDLKMPVMDGFELVNAIRRDKNFRNIPVVAASASVMKKNMEKVQKHEFDGFLFKPIQLNDLYIEMMKFLPHEIKEKETDSKHGKSKKISKEVLKNLPEVLEIIENQMLPIWEQMGEQQPMDEVEKFAKEIIQLGERFNIQNLIEYGFKLVSAVDNFNVDAMLSNLKKFPIIIEELKQNVKYKYKS